MSLHHATLFEKVGHFEPTFLETKLKQSSQTSNMASTPEQSLPTKTEAGTQLSAGDGLSVYYPSTNTITHPCLAHPVILQTERNAASSEASQSSSATTTTIVPGITPSPTRNPTIDLNIPATARAMETLPPSTHSPNHVQDLTTLEEFRAGVRHDIRGEMNSMKEELLTIAAKLTSIVEIVEGENHLIEVYAETGTERKRGKRMSRELDSLLRGAMFMQKAKHNRV